MSNCHPSGLPLNVVRIATDVMRHVLIDHVVHEEEERYQAAVQEALAMSYDDFLELAEAPARDALLSLLNSMDPEAKGLSDEQFDDFERHALHLRAVFGLRVLEEQPEERTRHISQHVKDAVWRRDQGRCVECGSQERLEFDHIIPFARGGANTYRNVQLLCEPCNRAKSDVIG